MSPHDKRVIERAIEVLKSGRLVVFPTDTLYALGARASDASAVQRVFAIKGREAGKALPLFVEDAAMAERIAEVTPSAQALAEAFWPGALTLVLQKKPAFDSEALAGGETVALRAPAHETALAIVGALGEPVTATSANLSGGADPVTADEVRRQLADAVELVIDEGPCRVGTSSTIVDCTGDEPRILRHGAVSEEEVRRALAPLASRRL